MSVYLKIFVASLACLGLFDFIWLGFIVRGFNNEQLSGIALMSNGQISPRPVAVMLAYPLMAFAFTVFVGPAILDGTWLRCLLLGAALGLSIYGLYDLTNLAILKTYPLPFAIVDISWGATVYAITSLVVWSLRGYLT